MQSAKTKNQKRERAKMMIKESIKMVKHLFKEAIDGLKGSSKRRAAAQIAKEYGKGGQSYVSREFGISRNTLRKGKQEIESGKEVRDRHSDKGRKKATEKLPELRTQIKKIFDSQSQADPKLRTDRLYTKMSISELRKQLIKQYGYRDWELPTNRTLNTIANEMKYTLKTVRKTKPTKKTDETDLIFDNLERLHEQASKDDDIVRLSIDSKDRVKIGEFSREGRGRIETCAQDHDFGEEYVTPFGIMDVKDKKVEIIVNTTKVTADFIVDALEDYWIRHGYSGTGKKLLLNADNGPENSGQRTQFIKRMVQFAIEHNTEVTLAYYPPYHSKYNPVERVWGVLEQHWGDALLDTTGAVVNYIKTMTYNGNHPSVSLIDRVYEKGIKVSAQLMAIYEKALERIAGLEKWFIRISPKRCMEELAFTDCFY
jgi:transposase-like protein